MLDMKSKYILCAIVGASLFPAFTLTQPPKAKTEALSDGWKFDEAGGNCNVSNEHWSGATVKDVKVDVRIKAPTADKWSQYSALTITFHQPPWAFQFDEFVKENTAPMAMHMLQVGGTVVTTWFEPGDKRIAHQEVALDWSSVGEFLSDRTGRSKPQASYVSSAGIGLNDFTLPDPVTEKLQRCVRAITPPPLPPPSEPDKRETNTLRPKQSVAPLPSTPSPRPSPSPPPRPLPPPPSMPPEARMVKPIGNPVSWIMNIDYPTAALRAKNEGASKVTLTVSPKGRVAACTADGSAGSILNEWTCKLLTRRARFTPATDKDGKPVQGNWTHVYEWRVPPNAPQPH